MIQYGGGAPMEAGVVLKKGPWTVAEDETLTAYVREYGEGNWNAVQKKTWLARCGKSCRLRWANHLRPNLRKGSFSPHEERLIIQLHSQLGNKWARMAAQLPGRTDNEIKNYWNTRLKRFQRQGLPLYPPDISPINHQQEMCTNKPSSPTPASSFTFQTPSPCPTLQPPSLHSKRCYNTAFGYTGSALSTSTPPFFHTSFLPSSYQSTNTVYSIKPDLTSNQNPYSTSLPSYVVGNFADNDSPNQNSKSDLHISPCQLLEDLMEEALGCQDPKRRKLSDAPEGDNFFSGSLRHFSSSNNVSPQQDLKLKEEESFQINTMQYEDISKLLDWGSESEEISHGQSSVETTEDSLVLDGHQLALLFPVDDDNNNNTTTNPTISSYSWDNLPGFC